LSAVLKEICVGYPRLFTREWSVRSMNFQEILDRQAVGNLLERNMTGEYASVTSV